MSIDLLPQFPGQLGFTLHLSLGRVCRVGTCSANSGCSIRYLSNSVDRVTFLLKISCSSIAYTLTFLRYSSFRTAEKTDNRDNLHLSSTSDSLTG